MAKLSDILTSVPEKHQTPSSRVLLNTEQLFIEVSALRLLETRMKTLQAVPLAFVRTRGTTHLNVATSGNRVIKVSKTDFFLSISLNMRGIQALSFLIVP